MLRTSTCATKAIVSIIPKRLESHMSVIDVTKRSTWKNAVQVDSRVPWTSIMHPHVPDHVTNLLKVVLSKVKWKVVYTLFVIPMSSVNIQDCLNSFRFWVVHKKFVRINCNAPSAACSTFSSNRNYCTERRRTPMKKCLAPPAVMLKSFFKWKTKSWKRADFWSCF